MKISKIKTYGSFGTSLLKNRVIGKREPMIVTLAVTGRCNFRCKYCYGDYPTRVIPDFTKEEIFAYIRDLKKLGAKNINLIGGEPLIREDIGEIIDYIKLLGLSCHLSTNCSLIPQRINRIMKVDAVLTSLDGSEEFNDLNRGKGTFKQTIAGIKCALDNGLAVHVNMVITKNNTQDIDYMVNLAKDMGFAVSFNVAYESHSRKFSNYQDTVDLKADKLVRDALRKVVAYKKQGYPIKFSQFSYEYTANWALPFSEHVSLTSGEIPVGFNHLKCYYPQLNCYIDADGRMYFCFHMRDRTPVLNVKEIGIKEAWKRLGEAKIDCQACYTVCNNNANSFFSLKPKAVIDNILDMIRK